MAKCEDPLVKLFSQVLWQEVPVKQVVSRSALNRSQNSESIIREVFDSIIDFKSIFGHIYQETPDAIQQ